jgi:N-acetylneuraminate synthase
MKAVKLLGGRIVADFSYPFIIAELGSNHNGDMSIARRMIAAAKEAGADCVKFQSWTKETIFSRKVYDENFFLTDDYRHRTDFNLEQIVEKYSVSESQLGEMKAYADSLGIMCTSTPFSKKEVDFLVDELNVPFVKIASMDIDNIPFLRYVGSKGKPVFLSTGLGELSDIDNAIVILEEAGIRDIVILHCVSIYPPVDTEVNLNNIDSLRQLYPYPVGFSDHTLGTAIPLAAIAKGASAIEKHFTLDKQMTGWDHKVSADFNDLSTICDSGKRIVNALGSPRVRCEENAERRNAFKRSIVAARSLKAGETITESDLDFKRPGSGIRPAENQYLIGRTLRNSIEKDQPIAWKDLV